MCEILSDRSNFFFFSHIVLENGLGQISRHPSTRKNKIKSSQKHQKHLFPGFGILKYFSVKSAFLK